MTRTALVRPVARRVALTAAVAACLTAAPLPASAAPLPLQAGLPAPAQAVAVLLVNGDHALVSDTPAGRSTRILPARGLAGLAAATSTLRANGHTFILPTAAMAFLGHGLDLSLFDVAALRHAEHDGRLPVTLHYTGALHAPPGITLTRRGTGTAQGYLTAASAPAFGAALARQMLADHASGSYGRDGLFAGGLAVSLPGTATAARPHTEFPMHTVTLHGTDLAGKPDTGDMVSLANVTDPQKFGDPIASISAFYHGTAKFSVPAGVYWAFGSFVTPKGLRLVILPQFTVRGDTGVRIDERTATSKMAFVTPRPAVGVGASTFSLVRGGAHGSTEWFWGVGGPGAALWVNPVSKAPSAGTMDSATSTQLGSPSGVSPPYGYALDFPAPPGTIIPQHFVVRPGDLATVHERYYQDATQTGGWISTGGTAQQFRTVGIGGVGAPVRLPGTQTLYLSARPAMVWQTSYYIAAADSGQTGAWQPVHPGQQLSQTWNAYPLHAGPNLTLPGSFMPVLPSASRAKNSLLLDVTPFTDNSYGHLGNGFNNNGGFNGTDTGSYAVYQNGTKIAGGPVHQTFPADLLVPAKVSAAPSRIRFEVTASRKGAAPNLSSASQDIWTFPTRPDATATVPAPWYCSGSFINGKIHYDRHCGVQDLLFLRYRLSGLSLQGSTAPGAQALGITVSQLPLAPVSAITSATAQVSYDNGSTWQQATVTRTGPGQYLASYTAPASTGVSLRVTATDAAGATITETITGAYQTSS